MYNIESNYGNGWEVIDTAETREEKDHLMINYHMSQDAPIRFRRTKKDEVPSRYELRAIHASVKSFYDKAYVHEFDGKRELHSYGTKVMTVEFDDLADTVDMFNRYTITVHNTQSNTTVRHIREYLQQLGHKHMTKAEIVKNFVE